MDSINQNFSDFLAAEKLLIEAGKTPSWGYLGHRAKFVVEFARVVQKGRVDLAKCFINYTDCFKRIKNHISRLCSATSVSYKREVKKYVKNFEKHFTFEAKSSIIRQEANEPHEPQEAI